MKYLSKLQKVLLCVGLVLVVAALIGFPKYRDYCEMQALKAKFAEFADVEHWPEGMEIRMGSHTLNEAETASVKEAIAKLEFDGAHTTEKYVSSIVNHDYASIVIRAASKWQLWLVEVYKDGTYCCVDADFAVKNSAKLYQTLEDLQVKYPD